MITLNHFNQLAASEAAGLLRPCVAIPSWQAALVSARPFSDLAALHRFAEQVAQNWGAAELELALSAHPRIGEKPIGHQADAALSRQEQAEVNDKDSRLVQAIREGNRRYEARFGRVFLIRAKGRSGDGILEILEQRLKNNQSEETQAALAQLREITLLRLEGAIGP